MMFACDHYHGRQFSPMWCDLLTDPEKAKASLCPGRCPLWPSDVKIGRKKPPVCPRMTLRRFLRWF